MEKEKLQVHPVDKLILPGSFGRIPITSLKEYPNVQLEFVSTSNEHSKDIEIPLLFFNNVQDNAKLPDYYTIYFHGNGEDIVQQMYFYQELAPHFKSNIVAMEYSGYYIYKDHIIDSDQIKADAVTTFDYLVNQKGIKPENIIILGRSIGSGPACYLASQRKCAGVVIFSGFTSIVTWLKEKEVETELIERFDNIGCVKDFKSPAAIIHGVPDFVIDLSHAKNLEAEFKKHNLPVKAYYHEKMQHNYFSFEDVANDIYDFLKEFKAIQ